MVNMKKLVMRFFKLNASTEHGVSLFCFFAKNTYKMMEQLLILLYLQNIATVQLSQHLTWTKKSTTIDINKKKGMEVFVYVTYF